VNESTATIESADGPDLSIRRWSADATPHQWTFVITHGLGEHSGRYAHFAEWFTGIGATVYALDLRGHGRSGGQRGHAPNLAMLLDDIDAVVQRARAESGEPLILLGHSFGGLLAIAYTLERPGRIDRAIYSAPLLRPRIKVPAWKQAAAKVLPRIAPRLSLANEVDPAVLSHDPAIVEAYRTDPLVHNRITGGLYGATIARGEEFIARAPEIRIPFLLLHGRDDQLSDPVASQRFFARATAPDRAFCLYPGLYHEVLNEIDHDRVFADIESWLTRRTDAHLTGWNPPP
jgi:alpha-beta hydrolase superfamily lysophospholipase